MGIGILKTKFIGINELGDFFINQIEGTFNKTFNHLKYVDFLHKHISYLKITNNTIKPYEDDLIYVYFDINNKNDLIILNKISSLNKKAHIIGITQSTLNNTISKESLISLKNQLNNIIILEDYNNIPDERINVINYIIHKLHGLYVPGLVAFDYQAVNEILNTGFIIRILKGTINNENNNTQLLKFINTAYTDEELKLIKGCHIIICNNYETFLDNITLDDITSLGESIDNKFNERTYVLWSLFPEHKLKNKETFVECLMVTDI